jgi:hypothetical protein
VSRRLAGSKSTLLTFGARLHGHSVENTTRASYDLGSTKRDFADWCEAVVPCSAAPSVASVARSSPEIPPSPFTADSGKSRTGKSTFSLSLTAFLYLQATRIAFIALSHCEARWRYASSCLHASKALLISFQSVNAQPRQPYPPILPPTSLYPVSLVPSST